MVAIHAALRGIAVESMEVFLSFEGGVRMGFGSNVQGILVTRPSLS